MEGGIKILVWMVGGKERRNEGQVCVTEERERKVQLQESLTYDQQQGFH